MCQVVGPSNRIANREPLHIAIRTASVVTRRFERFMRRTD